MVNRSLTTVADVFGEPDEIVFYMHP